MPVKNKDTGSTATSPPAARKVSSAPAIPLGGDFVTSKILKPQSVGMIIGEAGVGKSTFITQYCPGNIAYFHADGRADYAIAEARETRGASIIQEVVIDFPESIIFMDKKKAQATAKDAIKNLMNNLVIATAAAKRGDISTIAFDTGFEINELFHIYARGDLDTTKSDDRGGSRYLIDRQWLTIYEIVRASGAHFIVLDRVKQKWIDNAPVKDWYIPALPLVVERAADWIGHLTVDIIPAARKTEAEAKFAIKMLKTVNHLELKKTYTSDQWEDEGGPFAYLSSRVYPKVTNKKVWMP